MWVRKLDILWEKRWCYCSQLSPPPAPCISTSNSIMACLYRNRCPWTMRGCNHRSWSPLASGCPCKMLECKAVPTAPTLCRLRAVFGIRVWQGMLPDWQPRSAYAGQPLQVLVSGSRSSQGFDVCCVCGEVPGVMVWRTSFADLGPACARKEAKPLLRRP